MPSAGDALLYAVSSRQTMPWNSFKAAIDATFERTDPVEEMRYVRSAAASIGEALGHWDIKQDGHGSRVVCAPPLLARLPWRGMPRAVLCGSRSPDTVPEVIAACADQGVGAVRVVPQTAFHAYAPARVEVVALVDGGIEALAAQIRVRYAAEPPAWDLAHACREVLHYVDSLVWQPDDHLDWPRRDFDVDRLAFGPPRSSSVDGKLGLSVFEHPQGWDWRHRLQRDGKFAEVDRSMGRFAVLAAAGVRVMRYDYRAGTVNVPRQLPLPDLAGRALALCSGQPPAVLATGALAEYQYRGVPASVFDVVATKLGQHCGEWNRPVEG